MRLKVMEAALIFGGDISPATREISVLNIPLVITYRTQITLENGKAIITWRGLSTPVIPIAARPPMATVLSAVKKSLRWGGDTQFVDMGPSLSRLPLKSKNVILGRRAIHIFTKDAATALDSCLNSQ